MKTLVYFAIFLITIADWAQNDLSNEKAKEIINTFFEGFHKGDTVTMKSVMNETMAMSSVFQDKDGRNIFSEGDSASFLKAIAKRPENQKWEERILGYTVQSDGNLGHVWIPYEFWLNGEFSHCGVNSFTLIKTDAGWKIESVIDSRRKKSCKPIKKD